ncbi:MAG: hypothetical protein V7603_2519 [Micromonosporaceae bacterium]
MTGAVDTEAGPEQAMRLHRLMTAYLSSKALFCALQLGVFDALANGPAGAEEVGAKLGLPERSARVLLLALAGEDLVSRMDGRYHNINNTQGGEAYDQALTEGWLREVGFRDIRVAQVSPISAVLTATK